MQAILPRTSTVQVGTAIESAAQFLLQYDLVYGHGTTSAVDDAAWLVLECAHLSPIEQPDYSLPLSKESLERCEALLWRRALERVPVAYLVGRSWFAGLEFKVDQRALVPRSPISELILNEFHGMIDTQSPFSVLDLCTGGGCIAVAIAHLLPGATVVASDLSADALALARENVTQYELQQRITLLEGDLFAPLAALNTRGQSGNGFDLIVSNPPYVDKADINSMGAEFLLEPAMGLASGTDGLDITRRILSGAADYLAPEGVLIVEVGNSAEALDKSYPGLPFLWFDFANGGDGVFALHRRDLPANR